MLQTLLMSSRFSPERIPSWHDNLLRFLDSKSHLTSITSSHFFAPIVITIAIGLKRLENVADVQVSEDIIFINALSFSDSLYSRVLNFIFILFFGFIFYSF